MKREIISRSYVLLENAKTLQLEYALITEPEKHLPYGVEILEISEDGTRSESCLELTSTYQTMVTFVDTLAQSYVSPTTLRDIVEDNSPIDAFVLSDPSSQSIPADLVVSSR